jgi:hypothetical protein
MACFTAANAREMAARSHEARRERFRMAENDPTTTEHLPDFVAQRLVRVRKQLDRLDRLIMTVEDPQKLDRLASAQARLAEQERILDGRPLPGSLRPKPPKAKSWRDFPGPE